MGVHDLEVQPDLAAADARQVQQVVDQPRLGLDVAADHRDLLAELRRRRVVGCSRCRLMAASTGVSGVRSSCDRTLRNWSLARLAASAASFGLAPRASAASAPQLVLLLLP